jgi:hypothetical protein
VPQDVTIQPAIQRTPNKLFIGNGASLVKGSTATFLTEEGNGTIQAFTGLALAEHFSTPHRVVLTLTNMVMPTVDATTNGAQGNVPLYNLPKGNIVLVGASSNLTVVGDGTGVTATAAVVTALGTVAPAADATLTSTEANIIPSTVSTLTASAGVMKGKTTALSILDNTTTTAANLQVKLNAAIPDAGSTANGTLTFNGTIEILYFNLGDS